MPPLRIGVNALYLIPGGVGGTEIYLRALLAALAEIDSTNRYFIFTNRETGPDIVPAAPNFTHRPQAVSAASRPARILWEQTVLPYRAARLRLDVVLNPGFTAPLASRVPQVTVFHDLQHKRHPEMFRWFDLPFWKFFLYWSARRSSAVIAISETTAADLIHYYRLPKDKIHVVMQGVDSAFADLRSRRRPEKFILAVSTLHPHKNLDGLLRAFAIFRRTHPDFRLIVCGLHGFFTGPLHELRRSLSLQDCVDFPGWIPRPEVYDLYARAWAFVYPSKFEGFGLPVVEAMSAGVPLACSNIEPLASIVRDAAIEFDPNDPNAIAQAMTRITEDELLRARLMDAGEREAKRFSWSKTAEGTLAALCSVTRS